MEKVIIRHLYNAQISSVHVRVENEIQEIHVALFFNDGLLALDAHTKLVNRLGHEFGLTVIENENGLRVELEFSNENDLLYTDLIPYKKSELDSISILTKQKIHLYFIYYNKDIPVSIKDEPLSFFKTKLK